MSTMTLGLALLSPAVSMTVFAAPMAATEQQATQGLTRQLSGLRSFSAQFEQSTKSVTKKTATQKKSLTSQHLNQTFTGVMKVERPGKFYWETYSPSKQLIVASGKTLWIYDPDLEQAVRQNMNEQVANTPALLLSGNTNQIMQSYQVKQPDLSKPYYTLIPKSKESAFQDLTLSFSSNGTPELMILNDSLGQTTTVHFKNVVKNAQFTSATFNFVPPKGTDIIDQ